MWINYKNMATIKNIAKIINPIMEIIPAHLWISLSSDNMLLSNNGGRCASDLRLA
jgi:hypothetical protein